MDLRLHPCSVAPAEGPEKCGPTRPTPAGSSCSNALWECWDRGRESLESFTIITTAAFPGLADIHHRQPVIVDPDRVADWLDPASPMLRLFELLREPHAGPYERRSISARVNSVGNDDSDILTSVSEKGLF